MAKGVKGHQARIVTFIGEDNGHRKGVVDNHPSETLCCGRCLQNSFLRFHVDLQESTMRAYINRLDYVGYF